MKTVFISRFLAKDSRFKPYLQKLGWKVTDMSLVRVSGILFPDAPKCDWIFFSGKTAIRYFFEQQPFVHSATRFAVPGKGSEQTLRQYGRTASFVGHGNDLTLIARRFAKKVEGKKVLFPQSIDSLQTVQRCLSLDTNAKDLFVYKTELKTDFKLPRHELMIFTSPSNVHAYFAKYDIKPGTRVMAIGTTSMKALNRMGITDVILPESFDEKSLINKIKEVFHPVPQLTGP